MIDFDGLMPIFYPNSYNLIILLALPIENLNFKVMSSPPPVDQEQKVMADSGVAATVSVSLHPLVCVLVPDNDSPSMLLLSR